MDFIKKSNILIILIGLIFLILFLNKKTGWEKREDELRESIEKDLLVLSDLSLEIVENKAVCVAHKVVIAANKLHCDIYETLSINAALEECIRLNPSMFNILKAAYKSC